MLTESCVMFFSLSRAVLSAILWDEYLTLAVGTKDGDKAGSNQPPARDPVQFTLELTPNYLNSYLENTGSRSTRYVSMSHPNKSSILPKFSRKAILKLQDQLSQHARRFKSTNQYSWPLEVQNHNPAPDTDFFGPDTLIGGFESTRIPQMPLAEIFAPVMLRKLVLQLQGRFSREFWKDWALIRMGHGYISSGSGAGIFDVRN